MSTETRAAAHRLLSWLEQGATPSITDVEMVARAYLERPPHSPDFMLGYIDAITTMDTAKGGEKVARFPFTWEQLQRAGFKADVIAQVRAWLEKP